MGAGDPDDGGDPEQNEALRELDKLKDEFVSPLVSHELRTPLTSIRGYLELVLEREAGDLTEAQEKFLLTVVARNADRLLRVVDDLLFVAQIDAGKLALERAKVDLAAVVEERVEAAKPSAEHKGITLTARTEPVRVDGDRSRLAQFVDNLLSNAVKFTPNGGRAEITLTLDGSRARLAVSDTGMGIPPAEQERLFERFFRTTSATAQALQGSGLGLAITKAIVEAHGGSITFESEERAGTTFFVSLPAAAAAPDEAPRAQAAA